MPSKNRGGTRTTKEHMMRVGPYKRQMRQFSAQKTLMVTFIVCASFPSCLCAQVTEIPITPKPVGSGARALGQSAFIAVADDATAASWNPAGLINLERPEASFVGAWRSVEEDYSMTNPLESRSPESWSDSEINFMSYVHPLQVGNTDVVISINYHQVYDFGVDFNGNLTIPLLGFDQVIQVKGKSEGALSAYTLAGGLSIPDYPEITIGVGVNWYTQSLLNDYAWQIKKTRTVTDLKEPPEVFQSTFDDKFDDLRAQNLTFGLLWDVYERQENLLTFGLVYHTPFTASLDYEHKQYTESVLTYNPGSRNMEIDFPASFGAGVNYRFSDSLSAAFDVEWKEWSKYKQKHADGKKTSPFKDDTLAYRLGFEHLRFPESTEQPVFALRYGAFYEPRPAWPESLSVYGLSLGYGWTVKDQFSLDFAYQFRWGEENLGNFDYDIEEHFFVISLIKYF
ncbi:MAG: outer membrane protein transport protein [Desulfobacterales bacterium]|nr:outer membrane protein transport protein [Desulfobacterales bacterium]